jgi:hypothetical protein
MRELPQYQSRFYSLLMLDSLGLQAEETISNDRKLKPNRFTFRLGTLRTLSGCFLTYFLRPLRECLAQTSFVWSLNRGGSALLPCVSPLQDVDEARRQEKKSKGPPLRIQHTDVPPHLRAMSEKHPSFGK